jgi:spore maturation protein CgeB
MLEALSREVELEVWGYGAERLPEGSPLRALHRGEAWGIGMYEVFASSRVVVNRHIAAAEGRANNMRLFEATGAGALLLTEAAPNLGEMFEAGLEVVAYEGVDDLVDKVRAQLADDEGRVRIAAAGQARTLSEHTYARRMAELAEILEPRLAAMGRA